MWGCRKHWRALPARHRYRILATYRPGQEVDKRPSRAYIDAALAVQRWIAVSYRPSAVSRQPNLTSQSVLSFPADS